MSKAQEPPHSRPVPAGPEPIPLLLAGLAREDCEAVERFARDAGWRITAVPTSAQAIRFARNGTVPVILAERDTRSGGWRFLLERTLELPCPPRLIVSSRLSDESLWAEVLDRGGFDVVRTPFHQRELSAVVRNAWESWEREKWNTPRRLAAGGGPR